MSTILSPLSSGLYTVGKGVLHFYPLADIADPDSYDKGYRIGDCDSFTAQVEITEGERFSNEYGIRTLALKTLDDVKATITIAAAQLSNLIRAASLLGSEGTFSQVAAAGRTKSIAEVGVYFLGGYGITNLAVTKSGAVPAVAGTDYKIDAPSGQFEALIADLDLTYDIPAIASRFATGVASGTGIRGMLIYRGVNARGVKSLVRLHDVELRPTGARGFISDSEVQVTELSGTAYPVGGQPEGFAIGYETDLE
jgi:hypothetical protein